MKSDGKKFDRIVNLMRTKKTYGPAFVFDKGNGAQAIWTLRDQGHHFITYRKQHFLRVAFSRAALSTKGGKRFEYWLADRNVRIP